jgi:hypothetical protein
MNFIATVGLLIFAVIFGFVFEDILKWFKIDVKKNDMATIILFFPAFFFLLAFWVQPIFVTGQFALNDITKISEYFDGLFLWISTALFAGSGIRLILDYLQKRSK